MTAPDALTVLLEKIGACRRPIVGTTSWLAAWRDLLETAARLEREQAGATKNIECHYCIEGMPHVHF